MWRQHEAQDAEEPEDRQAHLRGVERGLEHPRVQDPRRYDEDVEPHNSFCRRKGETLQEYLHRLWPFVTKLKEVHLPLPDGLVGWHLLMRAGIPQWQIRTVKSACGY